MINRYFYRFYQSSVLIFSQIQPDKETSNTRLQRDDIISVEHLYSQIYFFYSKLGFLDVEHKNL